MVEAFIGLGVSKAAPTGEATSKAGSFERRTIVFGEGDSQMLDALVSSGLSIKWRHVNRSTIIRALVRVAKNCFNSVGYPHNRLGVRLFSFLPAELGKIDNAERVQSGKKAEEDVSYERRTIVFGGADSKILDELVWIGQVHRWPHVNRSTIIRSLIRVAHQWEVGTENPVNDMGGDLNVLLEAELCEIDSEGERPGVNPVSLRRFSHGVEGA